MAQRFVTSSELNELLKRLNRQDYSPAEIRLHIIETYESEGHFKRHTYAGIIDFVEQHEEINILSKNLQNLIDNVSHHASNYELKSYEIAHKLMDYINTENSRKALKDELRELNNLKKDVESFNEATNKIQEIKGDITKEAVAITSIIIAVIGFLLTNAGILTTISRADFIHSGTNIFHLLMQVNTSMAIGVSVLMMIAAAFIHKKDKDNPFISTAKCIVPFITIVISGIILFILN